MVSRHGPGSVVLALALALAGCGSFVQGESGAGDSDSGTGGTTDATLSPSTSGPTDGATGGPVTTPASSTSNTTGIDSTDTSGTGTSESASGAESATGPDPSTSEASTDNTTGDTEAGSESTGPAACAQADVEPNGDPLNGDTQLLPTQFCGTPASTLVGTLLDGNDLDSFVYDGQWSCGDTNNPNHRVEVDGPVTACVYPVCPNRNATQTSCISGTPNTRDGIDGCCSTDSAIADVNCVDTPNETAFGYILVESAKAECADYTVTYAVDDA